MGAEAGRSTVVNGVFLIDANLEWSPLQRRVDGEYSSNFTGTVGVNITSIYSNVRGTGHSVSYRLETSAQANINISSIIAANTRSLHLILTAGQVQTFRSATVLASVFGPLPVVSIYPYHLWHQDGKRLSNGFIPRYGQEMKGRALAQLLLRSYTQLNLRRVLVIRGETISPELSEFYSEMEMIAGFSVKSLVINSKSFLSRYVLNREYYGSHVVIVDCRLEYFRQFSSVLTSRGLSDHAWIIFLHDFAEVQSSSIISTVARKLQHLDVQLFSFCQTVHGQDGLCTNFSSPASVYYHLFNDTLKAVSVAIITSDFNNSTASCLDVHLPSTNRTISEGDSLVTSLGMHCVDTPYGNLALTTSGKGPNNCVEVARVQFQLLSRDVNMSQWLVASNWTASGLSDFVAGVNKFDRATGREFNGPLTFSGKLRVLYGPEYPPFSYSNATASSYGGVDFDLLYLIADRLGIHEENIEFIPLDVDRYSWSDMVALVGKENSDYDMAIGGITATANRARTSNFSRSYFFTGLSILASRPVSSEINYMWRFFEPFNWTVWLLIVGLVVLSSLLCKWFGMSRRYSDGLWLSSIVIFFMNENRLVTMRNIFGRIYVSTLSFVVLILVSAYTANMATFLTSQRQSIDIGLGGLSSLKRQPVAVGNNTIGYTLLKEQTALRNLIPISVGQAAYLLRNGSAMAFVDDTPFVMGIANKQPLCDLYVLDTEYFPNPFAFAVSDRLFASHGRLIDKIIAHAVIEQFVSTRYALHRKNGASCSNVRGIAIENDEASGRLDSDNLGGVFVITIVAAAVCLAAKIVLLVKQRHKTSRVSVSSSS